MTDLGPGPADLTVTSSSHDGVPVLALAGELDMSNARVVKDAVAASGAESARRIIFDLSGLQFIDSAGIAVLLDAADRIGSVSVRAPAPAVWRVIEITGLTDVLVVEA